MRASLIHIAALNIVCISASEARVGLRYRGPRGSLRDSSTSYSDSRALAPLKKVKFADRLGGEVFIEECINRLLSTDVTSDGLISKAEFAEFLTEYCIWQFVCDPTDRYEFTSLPPQVQIAFVDPLCSIEPLCLIETNPKFGYIYNENTADGTIRYISEMCSSLYPLLGDFAAEDRGQLSPSFVAAPSNAPLGLDIPATDAPSLLPTEAPTGPRTQDPSISPITPPFLPFQPTSSPTLRPLSAPTAEPLSLLPVAAPVVSAEPIPVPDMRTLFPTEAPSREERIAFINEIGVMNGMRFIEVAYSSFLVDVVAKYAIYVYGDNGLLVESQTLSNGTHENKSDMILFAYVEFLEQDMESTAFALVDEFDNLVQFLSNSEVVTALEGPAEGAISTKISPQESLRRQITSELPASQEKMRSDTDTAKSMSSSLVGSGCSYDDFVFGIRVSTLGRINIDQTIQGCLGSPTSQEQIATDPASKNGLSKGGIVIFSVSSALIMGILVMVVIQRRKKKIPTKREQQTITTASPTGQDISKPVLNIAEGDEFIADTGDSHNTQIDEVVNEIGGLSPFRPRSPKADSPNGFWNTIFWVGSIGNSSRASVEDDDGTDDIQIEPNLRDHFAMNTTNDGRSTLNPSQRFRSFFRRTTLDVDAGGAVMPGANDPMREPVHNASEHTPFGDLDNAIENQDWEAKSELKSLKSPMENLKATDIMSSFVVADNEPAGNIIATNACSNPTDPDKPGVLATAVTVKVRTPQIKLPIAQQDNNSLATTDCAASHASLIQAIENHSKDLLQQTNGRSSVKPLLQKDETAIMIGQLIDVKDWPGLSEFVSREEAINNTVLERMNHRRENLTKEHEIRVRDNIKTELDAIKLRRSGRDEKADVGLPRIETTAKEDEVDD